MYRENFLSSFEGEIIIMIIILRQVNSMIQREFIDTEEKRTTTTTKNCQSIEIDVLKWLNTLWEMALKVCYPIVRVSLFE